MSSAEIVLLAGVLLLLAVLAALVLARSFRRAGSNIQPWTGLPAVLHGTFRDRTLTGSYHGYFIRAAIRKEMLANHSAFTFEVTLTTRVQGQDWSLRYGGKGLLGTGPKRWQVKASDAPLEERLESAGIAQAMQVCAATQHWPMPPEVDYRSMKGLLIYRQFMGRTYQTPSAAEFRAQLDLLAGLAEVNRDVNNLTQASSFEE